MLRPLALPRSRRAKEEERRMDRPTQDMLREGARLAASQPDLYAPRMHALSFLYLSHLMNNQQRAPKPRPGFVEPARTKR